MRDPKTILVTGASSGLGEALARFYAAPGVLLVLTGRDLARLDAVALACRASGAEIRTATADVTDRAFLAEWLPRVDDGTPIDLAIANAGISAGTGGGGDGEGGMGESEEQARRIFATNLDGVLNTIHPLIPRMKRRRRGQIALMSSLASFRGFPGAPAYCASKAAVRIYGESLRSALRPDGIRVSVICPGFVRTPMTAVNPFRMPFLMDADEAARRIARGLAADWPRIAFPWPVYFGAWVLGLLPPRLVDRLMDRTPRKP